MRLASLILVVGCATEENGGGGPVGDRVPEDVAAAGPVAITVDRAQTRHQGEMVDIVDGGPLYFRVLNGNYSAEITFRVSDCDSRVEGLLTAWVEDAQVSLSTVYGLCDGDGDRASGSVSAYEWDEVNPRDGYTMRLDLTSWDVDIDGEVAQPLDASWVVVTAVDE